MTAHATRGRLPNFLLVGATKCGTTSLYDWLASHAQVWMHPQKELRYFTTEHNWHRGPDWYRAQFAEAGDEIAVGEASNAYSRAPVYAGVPERIAETLPGVRILYLTRDPIKRIESHWRHRTVTGIEWRDPDHAVRADARYVAASLYGEQMAAYAAVLPRDRIKVISSEALFAAPERILAEVERFLGLPHDPEARLSHANETAPRVVAPRTLRRLTAIPGAKDRVKRTARLIAGSPLSRFAPRAGEVEARLSPDLRAELRTRFAEDALRLSELGLAPEAAPTPEPEEPHV